MILCKPARPRAAATAFFAAILVFTVSDAGNSHAAAQGLFGPPTAADMRAAPLGGTMRDGLRGPSDAGAVRDRLVSLNLSELARVVPVGAGAAGAASDRLARAKDLDGAATFELFPGVSVTARRTEIEAPEEGGFVWVGEDRGPRHAFVTLVINNNAVLGHIQTGGKLYSIEQVSGKLHRIIEIDQAKILDDMHAPAIPRENERKSSLAEPSLADATPKAKTVINVLVAHTAAARVEIGSSSQMQDRINLAISLANQAFTNSGVSIVFKRVGGANEISYNDTDIYGTNTFANYVGVLCDLTGYNNTGPCSGIGNSNAGKFKNLRSKRNTVDADLVILMRKRGAACGIAWQPDDNGNVVAADHIFGFSVVTSTKGGVYNCIEANTFAHESGHNQGLNHDRVQHRIDTAFDDGDADLGPIPPKSQYNFGHVNTNKKFITIMSYIQNCSGCTRIPYFSTPLKKYPNTSNGVAVGVPAGVDGIYGAADSAKRLNLNRDIVGGYR